MEKEDCYCCVDDIPAISSSSEYLPSWTCFYHAVRNGNIQEIERCTFFLGEDCYTISLQERGHLCGTALELAARAGQLSVVQYLVLHDYFLTFIHWPVRCLLLGRVVEQACKHGHYSLVEFVLDYIYDRKDVKSETDPPLYGRHSTDIDRLHLLITASHCAAHYDRVDILSMVIRNCYTPTSADEQFILDRTVFNLFINGIEWSLLSDDIVEILVATGYWKNMAELHKAVYLGNRKLVITLIGEMEDFWSHIHFPTTIQGGEGTRRCLRIAVSVFKIAATQDDVEMFGLLYSEARKRTSFSQSEQALLKQACNSACERGRVKIVQSFLTNQWQASPRSEYGPLWQWRLSVAMDNNRCEVAMLILERFYSGKTKSGPRLSNLRRVLTEPVKYENFKLLRKLIECASSLASNRREYDKFVMAIFMVALRNGRLGCVSFLKKNYSKEINHKKKIDLLSFHSVHTAAFGRSLPILEMALSACPSCRKTRQYLRFDNELRSHIWKLLRKGDWFQIDVKDDFLNVRLKLTSLASTLDERKVRLMLSKMSLECNVKDVLLDYVDAGEYKDLIFDTTDLHGDRHPALYPRDGYDMPFIRHVQDNVCKFMLLSCGSTRTNLEWPGLLTTCLELDERYRRRFRRCVRYSGWKITDPLLVYSSHVPESRDIEDSMESLSRNSVDIPLKALCRIALRRTIRKHSGLVSSLTDKVLSLHVEGYLPKPLVEFILFRDEILFP